jgi:predicted PurR-regulated permease PerM
MLLGIPTLAVIYTLLSEITYHRLRKKQKIEPLCMDLDKNASLFDKK